MEYEESHTVSNYGIIRTSSKCTCIASYDVDGVQATLVFATFEHKRMHYGDTLTFTIISGSSHWQSFGFLTLAEFWMKYLRICFLSKKFPRSLKVALFVINRGSLLLWCIFSSKCFIWFVC